MPIEMASRIFEQGKAKDKLIEKLQDMLRDSVDEVKHCLYEICVTEGETDLLSNLSSGS